jgi:hypothetical protein
MTPSKGFRSDAGNARRTAVHVVAAALAGAAMFAAAWAGPAAAASSSSARARVSASPAPGRVKYYVVPKGRNGAGQSLYAIAARTLGDGNLFTEIFDLNKGRLQPDGGRLEHAHEIFAGWILELPADASGPGVHFGRLPGVSAPPAPPVSHQPSRPAAARAAPHRSLVSWADTSGVIVIVVIGAGLAVGLRRRRTAAAVRRRPTHARASGPRGGARTGPAAAASPGIRAADPRWPATDYPSWPAADHPSFPGANYPSYPGADYPSFPGADHPSYPGADHPSFPGADHPSFPGAGPGWSAADYPGWTQSASLSSAPGKPDSAGGWGPPGAPPAGAPGLPYRWTAPVAATAGMTTQAPHDGARGDGRFPVGPAGALAGTWEPATGPVARAEEILQLAGEEAARLADRVPREAGETRNADSVWLAGRILSDADAQATAMGAAAEREAAEIKRQAAEIRAAAEREAAEIKQQAAEIRATAELDAAELRATVMTMATDLSRVAGYVTENLTIPARPATKPAARPATKPAARPVTKPAARPAAKPAAEPATRPAAKPDGPPRQYTAMRLTRAVTAILLLFAVIAGTTELGLHGYSFFVFRAAGTGSTPNSGIPEDQGPGQPDARGAHQQPAGHKP